MNESKTVLPPMEEHLYLNDNSESTTKEDINVPFRHEIGRLIRHGCNSTRICVCRWKIVIILIKPSFGTLDCFQTCFRYSSGTRDKGILFGSK